jgi:hypothetical protein
MRVNYRWYGWLPFFFFPEEKGRKAGPSNGFTSRLYFFSSETLSLRIGFIGALPSPMPRLEPENKEGGT